MGLRLKQCGAYKRAPDDEDRKASSRILGCVAHLPLVIQELKGLGYHSTILRAKGVDHRLGQLGFPSRYDGNIFGTQKVVFVQPLEVVITDPGPTN